MAQSNEITPEEILSFWFPDGDNPTLDQHMDLWKWRMQGGANDEIMARFVDVTEKAAKGAYDDWADTPHGRLALIILVDQFPRTVWAGTPQAFENDPKALSLALEGLGNGHFDALEHVWYKSMYAIALCHCECKNHLAHLDVAIDIAERQIEEVHEHLKDAYRWGADQPRLHRKVIAQFGRHPHRNAILGRVSSPEEEAYIKAGVFPHQREMKL
ncbi:DUF924 family protein [Cognatishimia maritima]|uniref:Uncharacterized conserved protein, DUF924 family n=1 Tax=Cognatishimia maritima TaxID=870908 RepID=A0A1M5J0V0_9RHOB|nr:DUF924 family protein [Cognatishimia maritima]SHG34207.1 Uncharacterized conserved protein, DUF924 family [Cognatishimia maritima]